MKTYPQYTEDNRLHSFEISNLLCGRSRATKIVEAIPEAKILRKPKKILSWFREEVFCEFELDCIKFQIAEPFGDNSRYWIGSLQNEISTPIEKILEAFNAA